MISTEVLKEIVIFVPLPLQVVESLSPLEVIDYLFVLQYAFISFDLFSSMGD